MGNQASYERNVSILSCLAYDSRGPWFNVRQVKTYMQGKTVDREIIRQFLDDQVIIGNVEKRDVKHEKHRFEYQITEKGRKLVNDFLNLNPALKRLLDWKPNDKKNKS